MNAKVHSWLILTRGSNLPTVWSNVIAGWLLAQALQLPVLGAGYAPTSPNVISPVGWLNLVGLLVAVSLTYTGGMILNDAFDARWDRANRSTRPIPAGQISVRAAFVVGGSALGLGLFLAVMVAPSQTQQAVLLLSSLLALCITVYNRWHKGVSWAPLVMGLCRALLPLLGFVCAGATLGLSRPWGDPTWMIWAHAAALWVLTVAITLVARHEATAGSAANGIEWLLFLAPLPIFMAVGRFWPWTLLWIVIYVGWLVRSNRRHPLPAGIGARVADRLTALPLIDAMSYGLVAYTCLMTVVNHNNVPSETVVNAAIFLLLTLGLSPACMRLALSWRRTIAAT